MPQDAASTADLAALVGSRLCHDLIGPIGAIGNGVELLSLAPGSGSTGAEEVALITQSVTTLTARLRFFRIAFGIARPGQRLALAEIRPILTDLHPSGRLLVDWTSPEDLSRAEVKAAFLLLLCAETALRSTGRIRILRDELGWSLTLASPRLRHDPALWALLFDEAGADPAAQDPALVQFALARAAVAALSRRPEMEALPEAVRLSF